MNKVESIKKACKITDGVFQKIIEECEKGSFKKEKEIADFIEKEFKKEKVKKSFPVIVAAGKNAVDWHHEPNNSKLRGFCVIDFGCKINGYCSDMTRTIYFGKANKTEKRIYNILLKTQKKCISKIKDGKNTRELYELSLKELGAYRIFFGHALGHGLTREIHAKPGIGKKDNYLKEGNIITIEPGIYIPNVMGLRIEDDILVTKKGYEVLSKSEKKFLEF